MRENFRGCLSVNYNSVNVFECFLLDNVSVLIMCTFKKICYIRLIVTIAVIHVPFKKKIQL